MKYYNKILHQGLTHIGADIMIQLNEGEEPFQVITRKEWDGFHFYTKSNEYAILFKDGHVETNMKDKCYDVDKSDWIVAIPTEEALTLLRQNKYI